MERLINPRDGSVLLPSQITLSARLMHQEFKAWEIYDFVRALPGEKGFRRYQFLAGSMHEKPWQAIISFFNELLVNVQLGANLYARDQWEKAGHDLDIEAETKRFHEKILVANLGAPEVSRVPRSHHNKDLADHQIRLAVPATWKYTWGSVVSSYDFNAKSTTMRITYTNRTEKKFSRFKTKQTPQNSSRPAQQRRR